MRIRSQQPRAERGEKNGVSSDVRGCQGQEGSFQILSKVTVNTEEESRGSSQGSRKREQTMPGERGGKTQTNKQTTTKKPEGKAAEEFSSVGEGPAEKGAAAAASDRTANRSGILCKKWQQEGKN